MFTNWQLSSDDNYEFTKMAIMAEERNAGTERLTEKEFDQLFNDLSSTAKNFDKLKATGAAPEILLAKLDELKILFKRVEELPILQKQEFTERWDNP